MRDCNELIDAYKAKNNLSTDLKVADAIGVSRSMISQIRARKTPASTAMVLRLMFGVGEIASHYDLIVALMESLPDKTATAVREILGNLRDCGNAGPASAVQSPSESQKHPLV